jgi:acyl-coenzyme A thioesterase PaaI-like protein
MSVPVKPSTTPADPPSPEALQDFASVKWAQPCLKNPDWRILIRDRKISPLFPDADRFCRDTIRSHNGMQRWVELYERPKAGSTAVTHTISLAKFGSGLGGFMGICHGGAVMTIMDEALSFAMVANEVELHGGWTVGDSDVHRILEEGKPIAEALRGFMVTAKLDVKFLKPVLCPGVVGIDVYVMENKGHKMRIKGVMKDGQGTPLLEIEGVWVRIGGAAKL